MRKEYFFEELDEQKAKELLDVRSCMLHHKPGEDPRPFQSFKEAMELINELFDFHKGLTLTCSYTPDGALEGFSIRNHKDHNVVRGRFRDAIISIILFEFSYFFSKGEGEFYTMFDPITANEKDALEISRIGREKYNGDFGVHFEEKDKCNWLGLRGKISNRLELLGYLERIRYFYKEFPPVQRILHGSKRK